MISLLIQRSLFLFLFISSSAALAATPAPAPLAPTSPITPLRSAPLTAVTSSTRAAIAHAVIAAGLRYKGTPYLFGANRASTATMDCSSFTRRAWLDATGQRLPPDSRAQHRLVRRLGHYQTDWRALVPGDLVFFMAYHGSAASAYAGLDRQAQRVTHVALYLGGGRLLQTYSNKSGGVRVDTLPGSPWEYRFMGGGFPLPFVP